MGGLGRVPGAPGTAASVLAALVLWVIPFSALGAALYLAALTVGGLWAAHRAERSLGEKDPPVIVIDEVAGMTLAALPFPPTAGALLAAFVLFRVFDVAKPFPVRTSQRLPGGVGIVVDDLLAGLCAAAVVALVRWGTGWP